MDFFFFNMREITAHLCAAADREGKTDDAGEESLESCL